MEEKRRFKRIPIEMKLEISTLFKQDNVKISDISAPIRVSDISKGGLGFISANDLPIGFYFNSCIQMGEAEDAKLYCVVKIIRKEDIGAGEFSYGCELVGVAPVLSYIFDEFAEKAAAED